MLNDKILDQLDNVVQAQLERSDRERNLFREKFLETQANTHEATMAYFHLAISTGCWTAAKAMDVEIKRLRRTHPDL